MDTKDVVIVVLVAACVLGGCLYANEITKTPETPTGEVDLINARLSSMEQALRVYMDFDFSTPRALTQVAPKAMGSEPAEQDG